MTTRLTFKVLEGDPGDALCYHFHIGHLPTPTSTALKIQAQHFFCGAWVKVLYQDRVSAFQPL